jgi:adenosylhomocysteine nucleosidase
VSGNEALLVANGVGSRRAAAAVDSALEVFRADAVVSTGFCGALAPELAIGDIVVGSEVAAGERRFAARPVESARPYQTGTVFSIDHVAQTAKEKAGLRAAGGTAVEMEAGAVAGRAEARGCPFFCIKVVTDLASEDMANDFNSALREDGHFDTMGILRSTLYEPMVRWPELMRLRKRCAQAALLLGEFIYDCRF